MTLNASQGRRTAAGQPPESSKPTGQPVKGSKDAAGTTAGRVMVAPGGFTLVTLTAG